MYIKTKELPDSIQRVLSRVGYGSVDIKVRIEESISPSYAGGEGEKGFCIMVNLSTGECKEHWGSWGGANIFNPENRVDLDTGSYIIPSGVAVVKGSIGGQTWAYIVVNNSNVIKSLDTEIMELSNIEKHVLDIVLGIKSGYRVKAYRDRGISDAEWEEGKLSLATKGYVKVNKAGAVCGTTEGKNAGSKYERIR